MCSACTSLPVCKGDLLHHLKASSYKSCGSANGILTEVTAFIAFDTVCSGSMAGCGVITIAVIITIITIFIVIIVVIITEVINSNSNIIIIIIILFIIIILLVSIIVITIMLLMMIIIAIRIVAIRTIAIRNIGNIIVVVTVLVTIIIVNVIVVIAAITTVMLHTHLDLHQRHNVLLLPRHPQKQHHHHHHHDHNHGVHWFRNYQSHVLHVLSCLERFTSAIQEGKDDRFELSCRTSSFLQLRRMASTLLAPFPPLPAVCFCGNSLQEELSIACASDFIFSAHMRLQ